MVSTIINILTQLFSSYMELEKYEEAVRDYEKVCKMDRSRGKVWPGLVKAFRTKIGNIVVEANVSQFSCTGNMLQKQIFLLRKEKIFLLPGHKFCFQNMCFPV